MSAPPSPPTALHRPYAETAARLSLRERSTTEGRAHAFEVVSRGDFVPGHLDRPHDGSGLPLVLVLGGSSAWARGMQRDLAVARIDLPLLGSRQSPKLSDRLVSGHERLARGLPLDADTRALVEEFARQSISDVLRTLEALAAEADLDASRVALVGTGLGASACAWSLPFAPPLRACVLAGPVGAFTDAGLDPVARIASADLGDVRCRLYATDETVPEASVRALGDALPGQPKPERLDTPPEGEALAASDVDSILDFVAPSLAR